MSKQEQDELLEALAREELKLSNQKEASTDRASYQPIFDLKSILKEKRSEKEVFTELIRSVALEEAAMANIIQAEANKIEAFTGREGGFPSSPANSQINDFQNAVARVLEALVENQKLIIRMIELSKRLLNHNGDGKDE